MVFKMRCKIFHIDIMNFHRVDRWTTLVAAQLMIVLKVNMYVDFSFERGKDIHKGNR